MAMALLPLQTPKKNDSLRAKTVLKNSPRSLMASGVFSFCGSKLREQRQ
jgi:hypothetical protein